MILKCPHCRFKYEDEVKPGIEELSCVCPRCAYPFTVTLESGNVSQSSDQSSIEKEDSPTHSSSSLERDGKVGSLNTGAETSEPAWITQPAQNQPTIPPQGWGVERRPPQQGGSGGLRGSCCLKSLIIFVIVTVGVVLLTRSCYESFTADDLGNDNYAPATETSRDDAYANDPHPSKLPKWVQGNWVYNDENGFQVSVNIRGRKISETSGGQTSYGTITFDGDNITADFGDSHTMRYKVYKEEKVIDCGGSNMKMKKIE